MVEVNFQKVGKSFGAVSVLKNLSFDIKDGEFVVLLGASGCGKTTLLRMTAGLETISEGEISIDGRVVNDVHPRDRNIAMVFQNYALYPTMKVRENIGFSLEVAKKSASEIAEKVQQVAEVLNLTPFLDRKPAELSGGQRQRVAMGRAMVRDASVFLFDEPLSNLDAKLRAHMRIEIRQLHDKLGATTIYVTHDQIEAMTMADKIALMRDGDIIQLGTTDDLYDRPNCRFVADFIGSPSINFLDGEIVAEKDEALFRAGDLLLALPKAYAAHAGRQVTCGIRPSEVVQDAKGMIKGSLQIAEKTGADTQFHLDLYGRPFVAVASRALQARMGEVMMFSIQPEKIHVFDQASGNRISL